MEKINTGTNMKHIFDAFDGKNTFIILCYLLIHINVSILNNLTSIHLSSYLYIQLGKNGFMLVVFVFCSVVLENDMIYKLKKYNLLLKDVS